MGSFLGYFIGFFLFASVGEFIVNTYNLQDSMVKVGEFYNNNAFWSLIIAAFTPLPYKVFTLAAGVFQVNLIIFAIASIIGRGSRYMFVSYIAHIGGNKAFWNYLKKLKRSTWIALGILVLILTIIFVIK
jgi:membrane protein YqaA with SNARE-associated domain